MASWKLDKVAKETRKVDPQVCKTQTRTYRVALCATDDDAVYA